MKRLLILLTIFTLSTEAFAYSTEASKYIETQYLNQDNKSIKLKVKKEYSDECSLIIGDTKISNLKYGFANLKIKGKRTTGVSYICLYDECNNPVFGYIISK